MVKRALLSVVLAGCVESASAAEQSLTPYAFDAYLKLGDIQGESQDSKHNLKNMIFAWSFNSDDSADAVLAIDCIGFACHLETVAATRQSGSDSTSVWRLSSAEPSQAHAVVRGTSADDKLTLYFASGGTEDVASASLVYCVPPPGCVQLKGEFCVPICTLR